MAIRKVEILLNSIMNLRPSVDADIAVGLAKVLCNQNEVNDPATLEKLVKIESNCLKGLTLSECKALYERYFDEGLTIQIYHEEKDIRVSISELRKSFEEIYYKVIDFVMNLDYDQDYNIGSSRKEREIFDKHDSGV